MPVIPGGNGDDTLLGSLGGDIINGFGGNDLIYGGGQEVAPTDLGDLIGGGDGSDLIYGNGGNDTLNGERGNDTIYSGVGADVLSGGAGADRLVINTGDRASGGAGKDVFALEIMAEQAVGAQRAVIRDFSRKDTIDLSRLDANVLSGPGDDAFIWVGLLPGAVALGAGQVGVYAAGGDAIIRGFDGTTYFELELDGYAASVVVSGDFIL